MAEADPLTGAGERDFVVADIPFGASHVEADSDAAMGPLIRNAWYVMAEAAKVDRSLRAITVVGEPLVYFRTEAGAPVVLDDRCPHRRFPLSRGKLVGDAVECGYHGFTYEPSGRCIWAPGIPLDRKGSARLAFGVRAYPCVERAEWLWVWMGDPALADPATIPIPQFDFVGRGAARTYKHNAGNYMMLVENQLDLSHVIFLHGAQIMDYCLEPPEEIPMPAGEGVAARKILDRIEAGNFSAWCGDDPARIVRQEEIMVMTAPSFTYGHQWRTAVDGLPLKGAEVVVFHAFTPEDERNTHMFSWLAFNDPLSIPQEQYESILKDVIFEQDAEAMRDMQRYLDRDRRPGRIEFSMAWDRLGLKMRKVVEAMAEREGGG